MKIVRPFFSQPCLLLACALTFMASSAQAGILNATLIEDTYVQSSDPNDNFDGSTNEIYIRNHGSAGRMGLVQFTLPQLTDGLTATDITAAELTGVVAFVHQPTAPDRDIVLEFLALGVNPDLTTVTYNDLVSSDVITGYASSAFSYGTQMESLNLLSFNTALTPVGSSITFGNAELLTLIQSRISETEAVTITFAIAPSADSVAVSVDYRFYAQENNASAEPMSLTLTTAPAEVPEPGTMALLAVLLGVGVIVARRRR